MAGGSGVGDADHWRDPTGAVQPGDRGNLVAGGLRDGSAERLTAPALNRVNAELQATGEGLEFRL